MRKKKEQADDEAGMSRCNLVICRTRLKRAAPPPFGKIRFTPQARRLVSLILKIENIFIEGKTLNILNVHKKYDNKDLSRVLPHKNRCPPDKGRTNILM